MSRTPEDVIHAVVTLSAKGWSQRRLTKELGISRNTVRRILGTIEKQRAIGHSALPRLARKRGRIIDDVEPTIIELVDLYPDITAVRLHEELTKKGFEGGYTVVKERLREIRGRRKPEAVERFETAPGQQGQQDWSPYTIPFTDTAETEVQCFSFVLGFSRRQYVHFGARADFFTLIRQLVATAEYFGGLPEEILFDGQKAVVLRFEANEPIYNPRFLAFATHYRFRPKAVRKARHKGKVERPFQYIEGNLLCARSFRDLDDLNAFARWWLAHKADIRTHGTVDERPIDRFAHEIGALIPLPARPYDTAEVGYRVASLDAFVDWDTVRYSVPREAALDLVVVRATEESISVYDNDHKMIAQHDRRPREHKEPVVVPAHRPPRRSKNDIDLLTEKLARLGECGQVFAAGVVAEQRYCGVHLAQTLQLREHYDADDLIAALERAVRYRAFDAKTVARILESTATPRKLPDTLERAAIRRIQEVAERAHVAPRPLDDYARALRSPPRTREAAHDEE